MRKTLTLLTCLFSLTAYAQRETQNWFFGNRGGISFPAAAPVTNRMGQLESYEACATISDANGGLLFYSNSVGIWNRNHTLMPGSTNLTGHTSTTQGALIVPAPGSNGLYYLFSVDACDNLLVGGLNYSLVDMQLQNGLGGIVQPLNRTIATPSSSGKLTEKLTAVRHANGRDMWVMVHEWMGNGFFAFLVSSSGIASTPVVSRIGSIHQGGGGNYGNANAVGYMKASSDGALLGVAVRDAGLELFDFNSATGQVTNARRLYDGDTYDRTYGVAFSPDNTKLYTTDLSSGVYQYNLASANPASTRQSIGYSSYLTSALLLGVDGRIYVSQHQSSTIGAITNPNALGSIASYSSNFLSVGGICQVGLPNFPNAFAAQPLSTASRKLAEQVAVYPNPAQDVVWVRLPATVHKQPSDVAVFDALGQKVLQERLQVSGSEEGTAVKLPAVPKGIYTLQVTTSAGLISKKLVIQ